MASALASGSSTPATRLSSSGVPAVNVSPALLTKRQWPSCVAWAASAAPPSALGGSERICSAAFSRAPVPSPAARGEACSAAPTTLLSQLACTATGRRSNALSTTNGLTTDASTRPRSPDEIEPFDWRSNALRIPPLAKTRARNPAPATPPPWRSRGRFSRKAVKASLASGLRIKSCKHSLRAAIALLISAGSPFSMRRAASSAARGLAASRRGGSQRLGPSSSAGTTA